MVDKLFRLSKKTFLSGSESLALCYSSTSRLSILLEARLPPRSRLFQTRGPLRGSSSQRCTENRRDREIRKGESPLEFDRRYPLRRPTLVASKYAPGNCWASPLRDFRQDQRWRHPSEASRKEEQQRITSSIPCRKSQSASDTPGTNSEELLAAPRSFPPTSGVLGGLAFPFIGAFLAGGMVIYFLNKNSIIKTVLGLCWHMRGKWSNSLQELTFSII